MESTAEPPPLFNKKSSEVLILAASAEATPILLRLLLRAEEGTDELGASTYFKMSSKFKSLF